jgi:outer membrane immunogenic protein
MRRQFLLASVGAIAITGSAFSADLAPPPPPPPPPVPIFSWTGLYVGLQAGYAWDRDPITVTTAILPGTFAVASLSTKPQGFIGGGHIGYNVQWNQWVIGFEGTVDGTTIRRNVFDTIDFANFDTRSAVQGSIRLRAGVAFDRILLYATGGAAFAGINTYYTTAVPFFLTESDSKTRSGWTVGGGLQFAVTNNWSIRAEYRYSDFGGSNDFPFAVRVSPFNSFSVRHHLTQNQVQAGISYKFDSYAPVPVVAKY